MTPEDQVFEQEPALVTWSEGSGWNCAVCSHEKSVIWMKQAVAMFSKGGQLVGKLRVFVGESGYENSKEQKVCWVLD